MTETHSSAAPLVRQLLPLYVLEQAEFLFSRRLPAIPLCGVSCDFQRHGHGEAGRGKVPILSDWPKHPLHSLAQLNANPASIGNLGLLCGRTSKLIGVDLDGEAAVAWAQRALPATPCATATGNGMHLYFKNDYQAGLVLPAGAVEGVDTPIHVRSDGGQCVAPLALHVSGKRYQPIGSWDLSSMPPFPREIFNELKCAHLAGLPGGQGEHALVGSAGADRAQRGRRSDEESGALWIAARERCAENWHRRAARFAKYVEAAPTCSPGVAPCGASALVLGLCRVGVVEYLLGWSTVTQIILRSEWNKCAVDERGRPWPWSEAEIWRKCREAFLTARASAFGKKCDEKVRR